jgi:class 3 adenylate cyclase
MGLALSCQGRCSQGYNGAALRPHPSSGARVFGAHRTRRNGRSAWDRATILVASRVLSALDSLVDAESLGEVTLKGFLRPVPVFSVRGLRA